jgi:hypothetical protein
LLLLTAAQCCCIASLTVDVEVDCSDVLSQLVDSLRDAARESVAVQTANKCEQTWHNWQVFGDQQQPQHLTQEQGALC